MVIDTTFLRGNNLYESKFSRLCPIVLLVRTVWRQGRTLKSEEDEAIGNKLFGYVAET